ncbi:Trissin receptor [Eumeta japonica]|uniref:Trissin receptor n=1 Tax=Eumeta variegata TaxID=151549 RepID=A0A4C1XPI2_EUMVA|nr:Trissin receptor [Eumeta japonica]
MIIRNLMVIFVVTLSRRLRSITNFFLANLAVADLCVGIFCVFQNLSMYLIPSYGAVFGASAAVVLNSCRRSYRTAGFGRSN